MSFFKQRIKKDYQPKEFINPYFNKQEKNPVAAKKFNTARYLKIITACLVAYILIYSRLFFIDRVEISGTELIDSGALRQTVEKNLGERHWWIFPQRNFLLMSVSKLKKGIGAEYDLNRITIKRGWKSLKITVEEKVSRLLVYNQQQFYFLDKEGRVMQEVSREDAEKYWAKIPVLNVGRRGVSVGDQLVSSRQVAYILKLEELMAGGPVERAGYENGEEEEVIFVSRVGWRAYFSASSDPAASWQNLLLILKEKITNQNALQYIDLRFGNKVFYK